MTMIGRFVNHGVCILVAIGLLVAVISSPIRPSASHTTYPPNHFLRNFAILKIGQSGQFAMSARCSLRKADSLQSDIEVEDELDADIEDELTVTSPPASVRFDVFPSPCPEPYSKLVSFAVALAARPLRC